ncbi:MAG: molybdopterin molybdotransferase MoeA [Bacteroidales bacterium]|jgi:molybdopterin molybdotransferase|nr:molybdopterin molybdotransferase MoeA [Bacteroidales bacterium]
MITIEKAYQIVLERAFLMDSEKINFIDSVGRILAEDVTSDMDMPPFDKSAMDGYACRRTDIENTLEIIEVIPAGKTPQKEIGPNQCAKIMTGAPIPKGADFVAMVEYSEETDNKFVKILKVSPRNNISYKGEDVKTGQVVLKKGIKIEPQHIAVFASVGYTNVLVTKQPKVAIISTGDELVEPHQKPGISQIRNSNGYQLITQVKSCGAIANYIGIADDTPEDTFSKVIKALSENDLVLLTGGVSMGSFDFVPEVLKKAGIEILFDSIAVTPGKPTTFGVAGKKLCFGLPGNPVSSFIQFELLVKPLIYKLMGFDFQPLDIQMPIGIEYKRKKADRKAYIPVFIKDGEVFPVEYHGSAHIHALSFAHGIIAFPIGVDTLLKGENVHVRQI